MFKIYIFSYIVLNIIKKYRIYKYNEEIKKYTVSYEKLSEPPKINGVLINNN